MDYATIRYSVDAGVATITLDRPDRMNALTGEMRRELTAALRRAPEEARALVLTGAGRGFCAGQDLGDAARMEDLNLAETLREEYEPLLVALVDCPVPTVAAVNGVAAGAGANLALAADIVLAARSAAFVEAFARIGLIPDVGGTWLLPRLVGPARAMGMCLTTDPVSAEQAADWGLIWRMVEDAELAPEAAALAGRLADGPTEAFRLTKTALRAGPGNDFATQLALEAELQGKAGATADFREGVAAFLEKRAPRFEGR